MPQLPPQHRSCGCQVPATPSLRTACTSLPYEPCWWPTKKSLLTACSRPLLRLWALHQTFVMFTVAVHTTLAASHQVPTCILPDSWFCTDTSAFRPASEALLRCLHA